MNKKIFIPFILIAVIIAGFLGYQSVNAITSTYTQPLYDSHDVVATADAVTNAYSRDVIGNKTDAAAASAVSTTESLMAYAKQNVTANIAIETDTGTTLPATLAIAAAAAAPSYSHTNYLAVTTGTFDTSGVWSTVASHEIATVTGAVKMRILAECTALLDGATATIELGTANNTAEIIAQTTGTDLDATEIWSGATPDVECLVGAGGAIKEVVVIGGTDVGYTVGTAALTAGTIIFHIYWTPLDATGAVVAGAGGSLS